MCKYDLCTSNNKRYVRDRMFKTKKRIQMCGSHGSKSSIVVLVAIFEALGLP